MNFFIILSVFLSSICFATNDKPYEQIKLDSSVHNNSNIKFISHQGNEPFDTYLTMQVNFSPVKKLFDNFSKVFKKKLKNRGEAHITIITPIEFYNVLKAKITMKDIEKIALKYKIQSSDFKVHCLGYGQKVINKINEKTFFIVVSSKDLLNIRKQVKKLFISKGGNSKLFDSNKFYPHITLGFTKRDLHERDNVIKNAISCFKSLN